jgi:hypothetical protein
VTADVATFSAGEEPFGSKPVGALENVLIVHFVPSFIVDKHLGIFVLVDDLLDLSLAPDVLGIQDIDFLALFESGHLAKSIPIFIFLLASYVSVFQMLVLAMDHSLLDRLIEAAIKEELL